MKLPRVAAVVLAVALASCSSGPAPAAAPPTRPASSPPGTPPPAPPSPSPPATAFGKPLGTVVTVGDGEGTVTALEYKQPVATDARRPDQAGYEYGAAKVRVCAHVDTTVSTRPWTLVYADDSTAQVSGFTYAQFPLPAFMDSRIKAGKCLLGWLTFVVPKDQRPVAIEYQLPPHIPPVGDDIVDWALR